VKCPRMLSLTVMLVVIVGCTANSATTDVAGVETSTVTPENAAEATFTIPVPTAEDSSPTSEFCQGPPVVWQTWDVVEPDTEVEMLWVAPFVPVQIRVAPDGRVLAITKNGDSIYEIKTDGTLETVFSCPGLIIVNFAPASDGALWFTAHTGGPGGLYRVDPDGTVEIIAEGGNQFVEAGPDGSVYTLDKGDNGLFRVEPDGTQQLISDVAAGNKFAISPQGDAAVIIDFDRVVLYSLDGSVTELASGYGVDHELAFGPDGKLYVLHWKGIEVIDIETGSVSFIEGSNDLTLLQAGAFTPDGKLISYHSCFSVYIVDLEEMTSELFYLVKTNSWAMAYNPGDAAYIAFSDWSRGETTVYRIADSDTLEEIFTVPYPYEHEMAFDSSGTGYLAVSDRDEDSVILRFDPVSGSYEIYTETECFPQSLVIQPSNDQVWWEECNNLISLDDSGARIVIEGPQGGQSSYLAISLEDEFYVITFFPRDSESVPWEHSLYKYNQGTQDWEQISDLTSQHPDVGHSRPVACPDGFIYTVEKLGVEFLPPEKSNLTHSAVRRLESDGTLSLIGYDFAYDPQSVDCDFGSNRIILTSGVGVFAVTPP